MNDKALFIALYDYVSTIHNVLSDKEFIAHNESNCAVNVLESRFVFERITELESLFDRIINEME